MRHIWIKETVDGGPCGLADFWKCEGCGASGGPVWPNLEPPTLVPRLAGTSLYVTDDCDDAKKIIMQYKLNKHFNG